MNEGKMNFEEFTETVMDRLRDHLPDQYSGAELRIGEFEKLNKSYTALQVVGGDQMAVPNIDLDTYFKSYQSGTMGMDDVIRRMTEQLQDDPQFETEWLKDYGQVKDRLYVRVTDAKENESLLSKVPHREVDGLAVTYHIAFETPDGKSASVPVNTSLMKMYGISEDQLHADALASSQKLYPATFISLADMMGNMMGVDADTVMPTMDEPQLMVLTNERTFQGAGALFYPGQMEAIAAQMGSDYFVLPSSIHEVLLLPDDGTIDADVLNFMIQDINMSTVAPEERLANEAYHYDTKDHVLEKASTFAIRMERKEFEKEKAAEKAAKDAPEEGKKTEPQKHREASKKERKSVLARLSDKKDKLNSQPKRDTPLKTREAAI